MAADVRVVSASVSEETTAGLGRCYRIVLESPQGKELYILPVSAVGADMEMFGQADPMTVIDWRVHASRSSTPPDSVPTSLEHAFRARELEAAAMATRTVLAEDDPVALVARYAAHQDGAARTALIRYRQAVFAHNNAQGPAATSRGERVKLAAFLADTGHLADTDVDQVDEHEVTAAAAAFQSQAKANVHTIAQAIRDRAMTALTELDDQLAAEKTAAAAARAHEIAAVKAATPVDGVDVLAGLVQADAGAITAARQAYLDSLVTAPAVAGG